MRYNSSKEYYRKLSLEVLSTYKTAMIVQEDHRMRQNSDKIAKLEYKLQPPGIVIGSYQA